MKMNFEAIAARISPDEVITMIIKELGGKPVRSEREAKVPAPVAKEEAAENAGEEVAKADAETPVQSDKQKGKRKFFGRKE